MYFRLTASPVENTALLALHKAWLDFGNESGQTGALNLDAALYAFFQEPAVKPLVQPYWDAYVASLEAQNLI